jgi:hypothetical protein
MKLSVEYEGLYCACARCREGAEVSWYCPPVNCGRKDPHETVLPLRLREIFMAVLRGVGVAGTAHAGWADVESEQWWRPLQPLPEYRKSKKFGTDTITYLLCNNGGTR